MRKKIKKISIYSTVSWNGMKVCKQCKDTKYLEEFPIRKSYAGGVHVICKVCRNERDRIRHHKNKENENKRRTELRSKNLEKERKRQALHKKNNRDKNNVYGSNRHARKLNAMPKWLTKEHLNEIKQIYMDCHSIQWLGDSSNPFQVDHIVPLQGKHVSGLHVPWNLQILTRYENAKKGNR